MDQRTLWDYAGQENAPNTEQERDRADRERSRRQTFKNCVPAGTG
jgi:hypothetical protein